MRTIKDNIQKWRRNETFKYHATNPNLVFCQPIQYNQWECVNGNRNYEWHTINPTTGAITQCQDFYDAIVLWNTNPNFDANGDAVMVQSSYPDYGGGFTLNSGYYLETLTCKMRYWDAENQKYDELQMYGIWDTDSFTGGAPGVGKVQTYDGSGSWNMQGSQVANMIFNTTDNTLTNQTSNLANWAVGSTIEVRIGPTLNYSAIYYYTINSISTVFGQYNFSVSQNNSFPQNGDASYAPGADVSVKVQWNCQSLGVYLDYPGWPVSPNQQTDLCKDPTLQRYIDTSQWQTATVLYDDSCFLTPSTVGWWNDGVYKRYWDGISLGALVLCGSNHHDHIRYHATNGMHSCTEPFVSIYQDANAGPGFSFYHPIYQDAALTTLHPDGFYSDGSQWREWDSNGMWNGNFYSCTENWAHEVRHRPPGQEKWICNAPVKTIYQTINTLTLGNNSYKPFTDASLQTLHSAQWFACCVQSQSQPQFTAHYWTGSVWSGTYTCYQEADIDLIKFTVKTKDLTNGGTGTDWDNWNDSDEYIEAWQGSMCTGFSDLDSVNVWQKKTDDNIATGEGTVTSEVFDFRKSIYANSEGSTLALKAMYANEPEEGNKMFAAWDPSQKKWNPQDVANSSESQCGSKGCVLEGTLVTLATGEKIKVEELTQGVFVSTRKSNNILNTDDNLQLEAWSQSQDITWTNGMEAVIFVELYKVDTLYEFVFNEVTDILKTSWDHWNLIQREGTWYYKRSSELVVGDLLPHINGGITIKEINITFGNFNTYRVDVTGSNLYFANNILTHNASREDDGGEKGKK
jgi:hypothetical protein